MSSPSWDDHYYEPPVENYSDPSREERIAAAEQRQQEAYENMGSVEEGMEQLSSLKKKILATDYTTEEQ